MNRLAKVSAIAAIAAFAATPAAYAQATAPTAPYKFDLGLQLGTSGYIGEASRGNIFAHPGFDGEVSFRYLPDTRWALRGVFPHSASAATLPTSPKYYPTTPPTRSAHRSMNSAHAPSSTSSPTAWARHTRDCAVGRHISHSVSAWPWPPAEATPLWCLQYPWAWV